MQNRVSALRAFSVLALLVASASALQLPWRKNKSPMEDPFARHPALLDALDELPVFTLASAEGQPLKFQVGARHLAVFYADVEVKSYASS